jgi:YesN/AraC family two-component response regulator
MLEEHRAMIEKRYQLENNICHAITAGDTRLLTQAMEQLQDISLPFQYSSSPVRSFKNLALMGNALYRKAAEYGGVHPLHLDHVSQNFAFQIEEARNIAELLSSNARIASIYCDLVKELSLAAFPPLIQEAITFLRVHLDQSFSLTGVADALGVNPTYLSRLFTKEVGMTFTDFVHHLRIEEAKYLLEHRTDSITTIASQVGFQDANYFARVFRKWEGMTPHEYRQRKEERRLPAKETT